jgi:hypothetical protein
MRKTLKIIYAGTLLFAMAALPLRAQNHATAGFSDSDLNATLGISDAWSWLQSAIVPLAMLVIFIGAVINIAELHYRQNKMLSKTLRLVMEKQRDRFEPTESQP